MLCAVFIIFWRNFLFCLLLILLFLVTRLPRLNEDSFGIIIYWVMVTSTEKKTIKWSSDAHITFIFLMASSIIDLKYLQGRFYLLSHNTKKTTNIMTTVEVKRHDERDINAVQTNFLRICSWRISSDLKQTRLDFQ
jgi:hypothetical protein